MVKKQKAANKVKKDLQGNEKEIFLKIWCSLLIGSRWLVTKVRRREII